MKEMSQIVWSILALAGPLSPSLTIPITPLEIGQQQQQELGYMPLRDDFERVS